MESVADFLLHLVNAGGLNRGLLDEAVTDYLL